MLKEPSGGQVKDIFFTSTGQIDPNADAATIPSNTPVTIFFNPSTLDGSLYGANVEDMGLSSMRASLGIDDPTLQHDLGCSVALPPFGNSVNITEYIKQFLYTPQIEVGNIRACQ